ncbi:MAG: superoxide dismutase family protein [Clostridia bacterium]|nr:superoxide dismutase family protein [Clostridia bacterium]
MYRTNFDTVSFGRLLGRMPDAIAQLRGGPEYPAVQGWVRFYQTNFGTLIAAEAEGLPHHEGTCENHFFGFHIHQGGRCAGGTREEPFADTGSHYNPDQCLHPQHAGDLPPLMEEDGRAFMAVLAGQLAVRDILGRSVVLHTDPDDFHTQPAGASGRKMACGIILPTR